MRGIRIVGGIAVRRARCQASRRRDWSGKGALGGVLARGNTETETINADIDVQNDLDRWTHKFGGSILHTVNNDVTSADRWELRAGSNYKLTDRSYLFGTLRYEDDALHGFLVPGDGSPAATAITSSRPT